MGADVNRGNRPLSPHLQVYKPQLTSITSALHRITGVAMTAGAVAIVWWLLAAATGVEYFGWVDWFLSSWIGGLAMIGCAWAFWFHFCNGIRHLVWDAGYGFEIETAEKTGKIALIASVVLTLITIIMV